MAYSLYELEKASHKRREEYQTHAEKFCECHKKLDGFEPLYVMSPNEMRGNLGMKPVTTHIDEHLYNCPNCGAPITGDHCEYCGTVFKQEEPGTALYADNRLICVLYENQQIEMNAKLIERLGKY